MIKSDLAKWISEKHDLSVDDAERAVNCFFQSVIDGLRSGKRVELRGFGTFCMVFVLWMSGQGWREVEQTHSLDGSKPRSPSIPLRQTDNNSIMAM